jgi:MYXO-CTERM domain-containing protein
MPDTDEGGEVDDGCACVFPGAPPGRSASLGAALALVMAGFRRRFRATRVRSR